MGDPGDMYGHEFSQQRLTLRCRGDFDCDAGWFCPNPLSGQRECLSGSVSDRNEFECTPCAAGKFEDGSAQGSCTDCPAGFYVPFAGFHGECIDCDAGKYSSLPGQSACKPCVKGQYAATGGAVNCSIALPGHVVAQDEAKASQVSLEDPVNFCPQLYLPVCSTHAQKSINKRPKNAGWTMKDPGVS